MTISVMTKAAMITMTYMTAMTVARAEIAILPVWKKFSSINSRLISANSSIAPLMGRSIRLVALNSYFINFPSI